MVEDHGMFDQSLHLRYEMGGYDHGARSVAIRLNHEAVTQVTGRSVKTISRFIKQHDIGRRAKRGNQLRRATLTGGQSHETSISRSPKACIIRPANTSSNPPYRREIRRNTDRRRHSTGYAKSRPSA